MEFDGVGDDLGEELLGENHDNNIRQEKKSVGKKDNSGRQRDSSLVKRTCSCRGPHNNLQTSVIVVLRDWMPPSDLSEHQASRWCTYIMQVKILYTSNLKTLQIK